MIEISCGSLDICQTVKNMTAVLWCYLSKVTRNELSANLLSTFFYINIDRKQTNKRESEIKFALN